MAETKSRRPVIILITGFVIFLFVIAYVVATAIVRPGVAVTFAPNPIAPQPEPDTLVRARLTVDGRDENAWAFVDLGRQSVVIPPDTSGWDLMFRRFDIVPAGAARNLGPVPLDSVSTIPRDGFDATRFLGDTTNAAIARWYDYNFMSHLLEPAGNTYAIQTADGRYAVISIVSYYCPDVAAGCVTFDYVYQPSGEPSFIP